MPILGGGKVTKYFGELVAVSRIGILL